MMVVCDIFMLVLGLYMMILRAADHKNVKMLRNVKTKHTNATTFEISLCTL